MNWLKDSWKKTMSIAGAIGIMIALTSFYSNIATSADIEKVRKDTASTIEQLKKSIELDRDISRLNQINDSLMKAKILQRQYPKDKDIAEDIETLKSEKSKVQQRIETR
ncbi:MAG: hypothetical protein WC346_00095 [Methanogenium sp.]|jgi:hypothetical protein